MSEDVRVSEGQTQKLQKDRVLIVFFLFFFVRDKGLVTKSCRADDVTCKLRITGSRNVAEPDPVSDRIQISMTRTAVRNNVQAIFM